MPRRPAVLVLAGVLVPFAAVATAAPPAGAASWSAPTTIVPQSTAGAGFVPARGSDEPRGPQILGVAPGAGGALFVSSFEPTGSGIERRVSAIDADGTRRSGRRLDDLLTLQTTPDRAFYLRAGSKRHGSESPTLRVSTGGLGSDRLGRTRTATASPWTSVSFDVGAAGDVLIGTVAGYRDDFENFAMQRTTLTSIPRGAGARTRSVRLPGLADLIASGVDARGTGIVLLLRPDGGGFRLVVRTVDLRGGRVGPERTVERGAGEVVAGSVATDASGGAVVAWAEHDSGLETNLPTTVRAMVRRRRTSRFSRRVTLDPGRVRREGISSPLTAIDARGRPTVAWTQAVPEPGTHGRGREVPRAAFGPARDRLGRAKDLAAAGAVSGLATGGATTLVGLEQHGAPTDAAAVPTTAIGTVARTGGGPPGPFEPIPTTAPQDLGAPWLVSAGGRFRAVWRGVGPDGAPALRWAIRSEGP
jgi:hypothetical protein